MLAHYLLFSLVIAVGGSVLGIVLGDWLGRVVSQQYVDLLGVPYMDHHIYPAVLAGAAGISAGACLLAGLAPAWKSARMAPANAMRSDPNLALSGGRKPLVERLLGWALPASFTFRIPLRNVFRARRRTVYTVLGIAFAMILTVATRASFDSIDSLIDKVFTTGERWDVMAAYDLPFGGERLSEVRRWQGVSQVQPALMVPAELKAGGVTHDGVLTAMEPGAAFHGFEITGGRPPATHWRRASSSCRSGWRASSASASARPSPRRLRTATSAGRCGWARSARRRSARPGT